MNPSPLESVRASEYGDPAEAVYLDAASFGLLPRRTRQAARRVQEARSDPRGLGDFDIVGEMARARAAAARLVACEPEAIALAPNTSYGINLAARLVASGPPGTIVLSEGEFPANVHPWLALESEGFRVERVPTGLLGRPNERGLREALDGPDVRAFALSVVQFSTGVLADVVELGEICRSRGILYCLDAIQSLGVIPMDVDAAEVDVLASGAQKWLCSPWGSGFTYIRPELHGRFDPPMVSWLSKVDSTDFDHLLRYRRDFHPDGRKFELGTLGMQDHAAMARSLELILEIGVERIRRHVLEILEPLVRWVGDTRGASAVTPPSEEKRGGIFAFRVPGAESVHRDLTEAGFTVALREGSLRVAPHFYNTEDEIVRLVEHLAGACAPGR
ncbi:MAG: aminotransferase class V-fold PLP-dependent enzyme [Longimicrobiales bacterium]|nr:aminotransferase class V-fold PLP-dependent enzyme [Longimicrobiales bacterium]